ncbi:MAG: hypothetical protein H6553_06705 [Chitinophagales bacterium]|nr:hypothetical protein [Chitinophagales bacterium]
MAKKSRQEKLNLIKEIRKPKNMATDKDKIEEVEVVNDNDTSVNELMKEFEVPKVSKEPAQDINSDDFEAVNEPEVKVNAKDFDKDKIEDVAEEPINTSNLLSVETSAALIVGTFDFTQQAVLTALHNWKTKNKFDSLDDYEFAKQAFKEVEKGIADIRTLDLSDQAKVRILERVKQKVEALPLTNDEFTELEQSLILILRDMPQYQLGPNTAIIMSLIKVMGGRVLDVFTD